MKRSISTDVTITTLPVFHDWTLEDVYKLSIKSNGEKFDRQPDGEPKGWGNVLEFKNKAYVQIHECECDIVGDGHICNHWRLIHGK